MKAVKTKILDKIKRILIGFILNSTNILQKKDLLMILIG